MGENAPVGSIRIGLVFKGGVRADRTLTVETYRDDAAVLVMYKRLLDLLQTEEKRRNERCHEPYSSQHVLLSNSVSACAAQNVEFGLRRTDVLWLQ